MRHPLLTLALMIICFCSSSLPAQQINIQGAVETKVSKKTGLPFFVRLENGTVQSQRFGSWLNEQLQQADPQQNFFFLRSEYDQRGWMHSRYQQYYNGFPVSGSSIIAHQLGNDVQSFNGDWYRIPGIQNTITLSEKAALDEALKKVNAKRYKWQNKEEETHLQQSFNNPNFSFYPKGELMILPLKDKTTPLTFYYVYRFDIYAEEPVSRANIYVDAASGAILQEQSLICTSDVPGTANTKYSGTQAIVNDSYSGGFRLREAGRGNGIETYNLQNNGLGFYANATDFSNASSSWTITTADQAATDAHWGAEMTYDYYLQKFNRNSIDNSGYKLLSYVHYSIDFVNAFWDGIRMTYGDGDPTQGFSIMTALDVCGHEITHGLVSNTAQLGSNEAGALNEGFADIFGTCIEWFARPGSADWRMGQDLTTNGLGIRNLANPNQFQQPDTYLGTFWDQFEEPHTNNGPCIYWFYLLCNGGSGTNDNTDSYSVNGIGMPSSEQIAFRALAYYMTSTTDYSDVREYTIQAAKDLFGACSNELIQTTNAWHAVGVGATYAPAAILPDFKTDIAGHCSLPAISQFSNQTNAGLSYTWYFGDGDTSQLTNPAHTYTANGNYTVKLVAKGCSTGMIDSITKTAYINVNSPLLNLANGASRCSAGTLTLSAWGGSGQEIRWYDSPGGTLLGTGPTYITPSLSANTTYYATSTATEAAVYGGPASPSIGNASYSGNNQHYLTFDVITPCTLKTVDVVAYQAGTRMVELRDANNVPLQSYTFSLPAGASTLTLNLALIPGTGYRLGLGSPTQTNLYRNYTGVNYPYTIGNNLVQITGSDAGTGNYYYYYNWLVEKTACTSAATPITATISTGAPVTVNSGTICSGDSLFLAAGGAGTYSWDNGASTYSLMVSPSTTTSYTVTGQSPGCAGTSTAIATVSVVAAPNVVMSAPSQVLCANALPMQLIGSPAGGSYSGPGLTADTFFPSTSLVGTQVLHYSYTNSEGCYDEDSLSVSVTPLPTVYLNAAVNYFMRQ